MSSSRNRTSIFGNLSAAAAALAFAIVFVVATPTAWAESFNVLHNFTGAGDGSNPSAGLTMDRAGNFFGTTQAGGAGYGTVFQLKHMGSGWIVKSLYTFQGGNDGVGPRARVIIGADGALYGTTFRGGGGGCGGFGCGMVFRLSPPPTSCKAVLCGWTETVLYRFTGNTDGGSPLGDLVFDPAGSIYGTAQVGGVPHSCGGPGCGVVWKLTHLGGSWTETPLYEFDSADGAFPNGGVVFDESGNLYGTTYSGGAGTFGTVFQLTPSGSGWTEKTIYAFHGRSDGEYPDTGLIVDPSGNLYGTTSMGSTGLGGTVFELTPSGGDWTFATLYGLAGSLGPVGGDLTLDAAGNLYGTTWQDGAYRLGSVFTLTRSGGGWTYTSLHDFTDLDDGGFSESNISFDVNGNLYGTAFAGGASGEGVVFEIRP